MSNVTSTVRAKLTTATQPTVYNLSMPTANTEYSQALGSSTKKVLIKTRDRTARLRMAFVSGDTATLYITIEPGSVYFEENLDLTGVTIYLQANKAAQTVEILQWS